MSAPAPGNAEPAGAAKLRERVAGLPDDPGVYLFRDARGSVLYVGKAQNLRARVRSYLVPGGDGRIRMHLLVPRIADVEVVATSSVKEALLLENELIKRHKPRFNVRLRDDKNYLALRIDPREELARFTETRKFARDGALHFGPYTSSQALHQTLSSLQRLFPLRTCSDGVFKNYRRRGRPCLEHSLGRCAAPCCDRIEPEAYAELVRGAVLFLKGRGEDVVAGLEERMREAAEAERFEEAAKLRDRIRAIESTIERQAMVSTQFADRDVLGLAREANQVDVQVLHVRQGKLMGGNAYSFRDVRIDDAAVLESFVSQFYSGDRDIPSEILLPLEIEAAEELASVWRERAGRSVRVARPRRGEGRRLLEMAQRNAALSLAERTRREQTRDELLDTLRSALRLDDRPEKIECYDVSHLQGALTVASRVVFVNATPHKDGYRRYKLREAAAGDDYGAMREVLRRRLTRLDSDPAPDLLLLDGGKGQLGAVRGVLRDLEIEGISLASLAKQRDPESPSSRVLRHAGPKRERVFLDGVKDPLLLAPSDPALLLLQRVRDESHRFAIAYHRELRRKTQFRSILDELPGIGPVKRRSLLRHLGSLERIRAAGEDQLAAVPKLTRADAALIHRFFRGDAETPRKEADARSGS
ncbi:MAG: excinuclease ABC subunit UvrC [Proteobacteria bacterium]|nr:excinuclease ABC subunit UvrC [Pseudomonadota bacterium]